MVILAVLIFRFFTAKKTGFRWQLALAVKWIRGCEREIREGARSNSLKLSSKVVVSLNLRRYTSRWRNRPGRRVCRRFPAPPVELP